MESFTGQAVRIAEAHEACLITGVQAFELWRQFADGEREAGDIIESILETNGAYEGAELLPLAEREGTGDNTP